MVPAADDDDSVGALCPVWSARRIEGCLLTLNSGCTNGSRSWSGGSRLMIADPAG